MDAVSSKMPMIGARFFYLFSDVSDRRFSGTFLCFLTGSAVLTMGQECYALEKESIVYIPPEKPYTLSPGAPSLVMYVDFHPYFLLTTLGVGFENISYCSQAGEDNGEMALLLAAVAAACLTDQNQDHFQVLTKAYDFLGGFISAHGHGPEQTEDSRLLQKHRKYLNFLHRNYTGQVSLGDVAAYLDYTPQYLANFLKKNFSTTFQDDLVRLRLGMATLLLRFSEETDSRIAALSGFPNAGAFTKAFTARWGMSTEEYRRNAPDYRQQLQNDNLIPISDSSLILDYLYNYLNYTTKTMPFQEVDDTGFEQVSLASSDLLSKSWAQVINIGPMQAFERPAFRYTLKQMQSQHRFRYGRCLGLFFAVEEQEIEGQCIFDFSRVFEVIDFMRSIDLLPFFELSNKPFDIYNADETTATDYEVFLDSEKYDSFFFRVFPSFIRASVSRYGFDYFSSWKFELWRKYNPAMTSLESAQHYLDRFQRTARILKRLVPEAVLGGPGFNTFLGKSYFLELLEVFRGAEYQPDFLSAHCFPYTAKDPDAQGMHGYVLDYGLDHISGKIEMLKDCIREAHMERIPLYITEYSSFFSNSNYINDSNYPALFILHQCVKNWSRVDAMSYWIASDIPLQYSNYSYPFFGGNGLFSRNSIPKSAFHAFGFLGRLGSRFVASGENYIVSCNDSATFQVLCFHPVNLNPSFSENAIGQELLHYPYSAFAHKPPLQLNIRLTDIVPGNYLIREYAIGLKVGNVLEVWRELNYWKELSTEEISYLRARSVPSMHLKNETIGGSYLLQTQLDINEARLYTFELHI